MLSGPQILIIVAVIVLFFVAPARLPGLGKSLAEAIRGFKKGMQDDETDVTHSVKREKLDENSAEQVSTESKETEKV